VDIDLSEEQQMVVDMSRSMLAEHSTIEIVRKMEDDPKGFPDGLWKQMGELGLNDLLIPESYGGGRAARAALVYEGSGGRWRRRAFVWP
jgi:alkylation response protein AidB-like acyl-CoA dehydrogenase